MASRRMVVAGLAACFVAVLSLRGCDGPRDTEGAEPSRSRTPAPPELSTALSPTSAPVAAPSGIDGRRGGSPTTAHDEVRTADVDAAISDPRRSNLPPSLFAELTALGVRVLRADVTGVGREAFPGYWGPQAARPCCRELVVHAAGASASSREHGLFLVVVVWSASPLGGGSAIRRTSVVHLRHHGGAFEPVHPWEVEP